jgi:resolvase/recombinase
MKYGYLRVSTKEQNESRQLEELIKYVDIKNIYLDKTSGKNFDREQYKQLKEKIVPGDEIYFKELDRLGRNKNEVKSELEYFKARGVILRFLDIPTTLINFEDYGEMQKTLMEMINSILFEVYSTLSETEYKKIRNRQSEGIAIAKEQGKYKNCGRKKKEVDQNFEFLYKQYKEDQINAVNFAKMMNYSRTTLYKKIKEYESITS